jgi:hypothetical protein
MPAKSIGNLLNRNNNGELGDLIERAQAMSELTRTLSKALPGELAAGIIAANIRTDGELVVVCRSSAWASRLRYETDALLAATRKFGEDAVSCSVRVSHDAG